MFKKLTKALKDKMFRATFKSNSFSDYEATYERVVHDKNKYKVEELFWRHFLKGELTRNFKKETVILMEKLSKMVDDPVEFSVVCVMLGKIIAIQAVDGKIGLAHLFLKNANKFPDDMVDWAQDVLANDWAESMDEEEEEELLEELQRNMLELNWSGRELSEEDIDSMDEEELNKYIDIQSNKLKEKDDDETT